FVGEHRRVAALPEPEIAGPPGFDFAKRDPHLSRFVVAPEGLDGIVPRDGRLFRRKHPRIFAIDQHEPVDVAAIEGAEPAVGSGLRKRLGRLGSFARCEPGKRDKRKTWDNMKPFHDDPLFCLSERSYSRGAATDQLPSRRRARVSPSPTGRSVTSTRSSP